MDKLELSEELFDCWNEVKPFWQDDISTRFHSVVMMKLIDEVKEHDLKEQQLRQRTEETLELLRILYQKATAVEV